MRFVGKGGSDWSSKGCLWGKKKPDIIPGEEAVSLPTPALKFLPGHKPRDEGCCHINLPVTGLASPVYLPHSLCWHINRTAVFEHCPPIPSPPNGLQWTAFGQNSWQYSQKPATNQETGLSLREVLVLGTSPFPSLQQLRQAPEIPSHSPSAPALVGHPGAVASPVMFLLKKLL